MIPLRFLNCWNCCGFPVSTQLRIEWGIRDLVATEVLNLFSTKDPLQDRKYTRDPPNVAFFIKQLDESQIEMTAKT